jgi:hypothetical protein
MEGKDERYCKDIKTFINVTLHEHSVEKRAACFRQHGFYLSPISATSYTSLLIPYRWTSQPWNERQVMTLGVCVKKLSTAIPYQKEGSPWWYVVFFVTVRSLKPTDAIL